MEGEFEKHFYFTLKMKIVAEDLHLSPYNNPENVKGISQVKSKYSLHTTK